MTTTAARGADKSGSGRRLIIMRHAKSDWSVSSLSDFDRPLNARGEQDAPRMGAWLHKQDWVPDWVVCSPAQRAQQTWAAVSRELGLAADRAITVEGLYLANHRDLLSVLADVPAAARLVMIIGHNPGLTQLLSHLVGAAALPPVDNVMPTAAIACCCMPEGWSELPAGCAHLVGWMGPKLLPSRS